MSRTYKDRPDRIRFPKNYDKNRYTLHHLGVEYNSFFQNEINLYWQQETPGYFPKRRKTEDIKWHWCNSSPGWWNRLYMNRPSRHRWRAWEHKAVQHENPEEVDYPNFGKKPIIYYY